VFAEISWWGLTSKRDPGHTRIEDILIVSCRSMMIQKNKFRGSEQNQTLALSVTATVGHSRLKLVLSGKCLARIPHLDLNSVRGHCVSEIYTNPVDFLAAKGLT
jgi:hypothetical protein